jgi:hypothetical protein
MMMTMTGDMDDGGGDDYDEDDNPRPTMADNDGLVSYNFFFK